jgi:hypothetical protein
LSREAKLTGRAKVRLSREAKLTGRAKVRLSLVPVDTHLCCSLLGLTFRVRRPRQPRASAFLKVSDFPVREASCAASPSLRGRPFAYRLAESSKYSKPHLRPHVLRRVLPDLLDFSSHFDVFPIIEATL